MHGVLEALALTAALTASAAAAPADIEDPEVAALADAAEAHYQAGRYAEAIDALERAYAREPHPHLDVALARAHHKQGDCARALEHYRAYLATDVAPERALRVNAWVRECEAEVASEQPDPERDPEPTAAATPPPARPQLPPPTTPADKPAKPPGRDIAGGVLVGVGGAIMVVGVGFVAAGYLGSDSADGADGHQAFHDELDNAITKERIGSIQLAAGGALVAAGIVRYAILIARARRRTKRTAAWLVRRRW